MKTLLAITLIFACLPLAFADGAVSSGMITTAGVSNLVSKLDTLAMKADVDAYANMLADDLTITITSDTQRGPLPEGQSKSDYVRDMRVSVKHSKVLEAKTTIDQITIGDLGASATVNCTLIERTLVLERKRICNLTMRQKFSLEIRKGELKIKKLESQISEVKWE